MAGPAHDSFPVDMDDDMTVKQANNKQWRTDVAEGTLFQLGLLHEPQENFFTRSLVPS